MIHHCGNESCSLPARVCQSKTVFPSSVRVFLSGVRSFCLQYCMRISLIVVFEIPSSSASASFPAHLFQIRQNISFGERMMGLIKNKCSLDDRRTLHKYKVKS